MRITEQRRLPRSTLRLPVFGLGCASLGGLYRAMSDADAAVLIETAWQLGLRFFDTAPFYGYTRSEQRLGRALSPRARDEFVVSTKVGRLMEADDTVSAGDDGWADPLPLRPRFDYTREGVMRSFDDSQRRCGTQHVDLLLVHDIGRATHGERHETYWRQLTHGGGFRAMEELRRDGCVTAIGLGVNEWQVAHEALQELDLDCTMLAGRYTLLDQTALEPFLDECVRRRCAVIAAGPFNSGVLVGGAHYNYAKANPDVVERVRRLDVVAREFEVPLPAAALQFPLAHPAIVSCVAGAHEASELVRNVAWFERSIPTDFWRALRHRGLLDERAPLPNQGYSC